VGGTGTLEVVPDDAEGRGADGFFHGGSMVFRELAS
jgi:hypothetical protein